MKVTIVKLRTLALIVFAIWCMNSFAQVETMMYVMKNGKIAFQSPVSGVDNVTFDKALSDSILFVQKNDGSPIDKTVLNYIQQLSFSDESLSVEASNGSAVYLFDDITKLFFGDINTTEINNPPAQRNFDVLVSITPAGDVTIKSSVPIKSLMLFSIDGKMISKRPYNGVETQCLVSLQGKPTGVYLLRVETEQYAVVKKVIKP